jgi:hypothetical protein
MHRQMDPRSDRIDPDHMTGQRCPRLASTARPQRPAVASRPVQLNGQLLGQFKVATSLQHTFVTATLRTLRETCSIWSTGIGAGGLRHA